jgi:hypothetical protein
MPYCLSQKLWINGERECRTGQPTTQAAGLLSLMIHQLTPSPSRRLGHQ